MTAKREHVHSDVVHEGGAEGAEVTEDTDRAVSVLWVRRVWAEGVGAEGVDRVRRMLRRARIEDDKGSERC